MQQSKSDFRYLIEVFSNPGDVILDTVCGSGMFLKVAKNLKRSAIRFDIDANAIEISQKKISV